MPRLLSLLPLVALAVTTLQTTPAHAAGGSTNARDGVLHSGCRAHPFSYDVDLPEETYDWSMDVVAFTPDGLESSSDYIYDASTSGTGRFLVCGGERPGRWTIEAEVEACDYDYECTTFQLSPSRFVMRKPRTKTSLSASPIDARRGQVVKFLVKAKDERPRGYFATEYATVFMQKRVGKRWVKIKGSRGYTSSNGKETIKLRYTGGRPKVRAVTRRSDSYSGSRSKPVTIR